VDYLSIYLDGGGNVENLGGAWYKFANFKLTLINQINHKMSKTMGTFFSLFTVQYNNMFLN